MILKPVYRAVFQGPIGPLNPSGLKFPVKMTVELHEARKGTWQAREGDTGKARPLACLGSWQSSLEARKGITQAFTEQIQPWEMWAKDECGIFRAIRPDEVQERPNGSIWLIEQSKVALKGQKAKERKGA